MFLSLSIGWLENGWVGWLVGRLLGRRIVWMIGRLIS